MAISTENHDGRLIIKTGKLTDCDRERGRFVVETADVLKEFDHIVPAVIYYEQLAECASFYDMTAEKVLVERKVYVGSPV